MFKNKTAVSGYAVITGAGKGLGLAFAHELASRGISLILVALKEDNLPQKTKEIESLFDVKVEYFEADLTQPSEIENFTNWVTNNFKISILINNVGLGHSGDFGSTDLGILDSMILLNVRATTLITHQLLPILKQNKPAFIMNISSMASLSPFGYKSVYAATKVFIEYFSKGIHRELKPFAVYVSTMHPGPMNTNAEVAKRIRNQNIIGRMGTKNPARVAKVATRRMLRKQRFILVGNANFFQWLVIKLLPKRLVISLVTRGVKQELEGKN